MREAFAALPVRLTENVRFLTYREAERAALSLAAQLQELLGAGGVRAATYAAVPRGGFFVLGMLAYALDVPHAQLLPQAGGSPIVVVDDASLSGARFAWFLRSLPEGPVVFAHLCSTPSLRAAILEREPRVKACLAAEDLRDLAPDRYPEAAAYQAWKCRWEARLPGTRYWTGLPEMVVFPWSEPDRPVWNAATGRAEDQWRLAAPERCLKNRARLALPPMAACRRYSIPEWIAYRVGEEEVLLCDRRSEALYRLPSAAAEMWRGLAAYGEEAAVVALVSSRYEVAPEQVQTDLRALIADLERQGLLEDTEARGAAER